MFFFRKKTYIRSNNCRRTYLRANTGWHGLYMCTYCGRIITQNNMEVDHIVSIDHANKNRLIYKLFIKGNQINDKKNLTAACGPCNSKKSNRGGIWIVKGKVGRFIQPVLWILFIFFLVLYTFWFFNEKPYIFIEQILIESGYF